MDYTSIKVGQLPSATIAGTNLIPHEVGGLLKKATITDLAAFISANGAVGFRAVSVPNGGTLPSTTQQEFILVGPGTYNNVGGGSPVTVTEELNALVSNGTFWFIGVQIPIEAAAGGTANWGGITGTLSAQTDLQTALNNKQNSSADLSSIAALTGTTGLLKKTAANTYTLDTNSYALDSSLSGYLPLSGGTLESSGSANTLNINHSSGSGIALNISKNGNGEGLTIVKGSGSGNAASITGGVTLLSELNLTTKLADAHINSAATWNAKIGGSGTTNYLPKFTSSGVVGNSVIFENGGNVGIGVTGSDIKGKLHIGNRNVTRSSNSRVLVSELFDNTVTGNGHAFSDSSLITQSPFIAYASYDARIELNSSSITGDHYVSYQAAPKFNFSGSISNVYGNFIGSELNEGTISNNYGLYVANPTKTGGTLSNNFGLYIENQTSGNGNYSIFSNGGRNALLGTLSIGDTNSSGGIFSIFSNSGDHFRIKRTSQTDRAILISGSDLYCFGTWANPTQMVIDASGNVGINKTNPTQRLDVDGLINSTNGISVGGSGVSVVWTGTQAAYDAITTKSSTTIYFIQ